MSPRCDDCGCTDLRLVWDNGAQYPETRVERYECADCGHENRKVLTA